MGLLGSNSAFSRCWAAGTCSLLAWWSLHAVMLIHVYDLTGSPFATGLIPVFSSVPGILIGPIAGVVVDRESRQKVMAMSSLALGSLLVLSIPVVDSLGIVLLYAIIAIQATIMMFYSPAENALLPSLVNPEDLRTANALNALNDALGRIAGPAIGAWTLVQFGFEATLIGSALLYACGWIFLIGIRDVRVQEGLETPGAIQAFRLASLEGWRVTRAVPLLTLAVVTSALAMLADVPLSAILSPFMRESVGVSAEVFGNLMSVRGLTGLVGGLIVVRLARHVHEYPLLAGGLLLQGASYLAFGLGNNLFWSVAILFPVGPAAAAIQTGLFTTIQKNSPENVRGRVFAMIATVNSVVVLIVSLLAGGAGEAFGTRPVVIAAGCLHLLPAVTAGMMLRHRQPSIES